MIQHWAAVPMGLKVVYVGLNVDDTQRPGAALDETSGELPKFKRRPPWEGLPARVAQRSRPIKQCTAGYPIAGWPLIAIAYSGQHWMCIYWLSIAVNAHCFGSGNCRLCKGLFRNRCAIDLGTPASGYRKAPPHHSDSLGHQVSLQRKNKV